LRHKTPDVKKPLDAAGWVGWPDVNSACLSEADMKQAPKTGAANFSVRPTVAHHNCALHPIKD